jgi:hypothetical protein
MQSLVGSRVGVAVAVSLGAREGLAEGVDVSVDVAVGGGVQPPGAATPLLFLAAINADTARLTTRMAARVMVKTSGLYLKLSNLSQSCRSPAPNRKNELRFG